MPCPGEPSQNSIFALLSYIKFAPFQEHQFRCPAGRSLLSLCPQLYCIRRRGCLLEKFRFPRLSKFQQRAIDLLTFCSSDHHFLASEQMCMALSDMNPMSLEIELRLDTDNDHFQSFSTPSACPSLTTSFPSYGGPSPVDVGNDRRPSIPSSEASMLLSSHCTSVRNSFSPMTPLSPDMMDMVLTSGASMACTTTGSGMHSMFQYSDASYDQENFPWPVLESKPRLSGHISALDNLDPYSLTQPDHQVFLSPDHSAMAGAALLSSLSRSIFPHHQRSDTRAAEQMTDWHLSRPQSPPRTVAPSATFQPPIIPSSPLYRMAPSTPIHARYTDPVTPGVASIPYSSSPMCPSSEPIGLKYEDDSTSQILQSTLGRILRASKSKTSRSNRRSAGKKESSRPRRISKPGTSRIGVKYPSVIESNSFACTAEGCVDKNGRRKKFKRQEHLKRHQGTCHTGFRPHCCWVPGCTTKPFSRTDNLNSHLYKTHGKNSPAARNRYIATLDPKSGVYDVDYRGPFTDSGWPIRSK
jgi:hypothetical protein